MLSYAVTAVPVPCRGGILSALRGEREHPILGARRRIALTCRPGIALITACAKPEHTEYTHHRYSPSHAFTMAITRLRSNRITQVLQLRPILSRPARSRYRMEMSLVIDLPLRSMTTVRFEARLNFVYSPMASSIEVSGAPLMEVTISPFDIPNSFGRLPGRIP